MRYTFIILLLFFSFTFINSSQSQSVETGYEKLIGNWVRPDGGYVLVIKNVRFDGSIEADYLNPNPINVSKAHVSNESGKINVFVELRDAGYPGSYYTLTYNKDTDRLVGVYHHMVLNKKFDIYFLRQKS
jgi:hypothetical protein